MKLIAGSSHPSLAKDISSFLNQSLCKCTLDRFHNGEMRVEIHENIRNEDIFIIQTGGNTDILSVNDIIMETIILMDACKRSMAKSITLVMPLFPYARQDKKNDSRSPISAKVIATMFEQAGMSRMVTLDLHAPQIQGFFNVPVDNIYSLPLVKNVFNLLNQDNEYIIVSPDAGGLRRAVKFGNTLGLPVYGMYKERNYEQKGIINQMQLMGTSKDVQGKIAIIVDDMSDTCGTLINCAGTLASMGTLGSIAIITHGVLSGLGLRRLTESVDITRMYVSDSLPVIEHDKIVYFTTHELLGRVIQCLLTGGSISSLFSFCASGAPLIERLHRREFTF